MALLTGTEQFLDEESLNPGVHSSVTPGKEREQRGRKEKSVQSAFEKPAGIPILLKMAQTTESQMQKARNWSELKAGMKALWIASFLLAFLIGVGMGIYLTFS